MAAMERVNDLTQELERTFDTELTDRVGALERGLLALEEADGASVAAHAFDTLHDDAYNLQGAARAIDLADVAHLAGALTAAFDVARQPDMPLSAAWFAAARRAIAFLPALATAGRLDA